MKTNYLFDEKLIRFTEHNGQFADFIWKIGFIILPLLHDILKQEIMKKTLVFAMLIASVVAMTCCTSDDPSSGGSGLVVSGASQPTLLSGVSVSSGTSYFGGLAITGGTVSGGTSVSLSSYSGGNGMGGNPGGGGPGGWH